MFGAEAIAKATLSALGISEASAKKAITDMIDMAKDFVTRQRVMETKIDAIYSTITGAADVDYGEAHAQGMITLNPPPFKVEQ